MYVSVSLNTIDWYMALYTWFVSECVCTDGGVVEYTLQHNNLSCVFPVEACSLSLRLVFGRVTPISCVYCSVVWFCMYSLAPWTASEMMNVSLLQQNRLSISVCPCGGSQKLWSGLSCSSGPFGSRRCVRCLCTELVRLKWEIGLYPVIPIQTDACRINYNTSENLNIMVRFHFSSSFSEAISLLWRPDLSL